MNLFEAVKDAIPTRAAAEHYGVEVKRNGMACCPFHDDKTPSMKVDTRFHCFGCQADGDVIDFTARLFGLKPGEAARKLAEDFGIQYDRRQQSRPRDRPSVLSKLEAARQAKEKEMRCFRVLCHYVHLMRDWKENLAPKVPEEDWHPLFCEALRNIDYYQYLLDTLIEGPPEERTAIVNDQNPSLDALEKRVLELSGGQPDAHISFPRRREPAGRRDGKRLSSFADRAV